MAEDFFSQARKKVSSSLKDTGSQEKAPASDVNQNYNLPNSNPLPMNNQNNPSPFPFEMKGNIPPELLKTIREKQAAQQASVQAQAQTKPVFNEEGNEEISFESPPDKVSKSLKAKPKPKEEGSDAYENVLALINDHYIWETFSFPSKSKFYKSIPEEIHVRPMTGEEEQILATPRHVKNGKAMDMIFKGCIQENIDTKELLSTDRTYLLIFLRGISYTPEYDVEMKCPNCSIKFGHTIDLNTLDVESCPEDFSEDSLEGTLPVTGIHYRYRLATGDDDNIVTAYRERKISQYGDQSNDDTLLYRTALLLEELGGVVMKNELTQILKKLPILDVAHLRNEINNPPFGVDTELEIACPACSDTFKADLPLETSFFFPRKRQTRIHQ